MPIDYTTKKSYDLNNRRIIEDFHSINQVSNLIENSDDSPNIELTSNNHIILPIKSTDESKSNLNETNEILSTEKQNNANNMKIWSSHSNRVNKTSNLSLEDKEDNIEKNKMKMWSGDSNIIVAVRVRPMNRRENRFSFNTLRVLDKKMIVCLDPGYKTSGHLRQNRTREKRKYFHIY